MTVIYEDTNGDQFRIKNVKEMEYKPEQKLFNITFKNNKIMNIWQEHISFIACKDRGAK